VHKPGATVKVDGISHLVIQVESMNAAVMAIGARGIEAEDLTVHDAGSGFATAWLRDPDGYRMELVQWPAGHRDGMTPDDFGG